MHLTAIGGDQVLLCRVTYDAGKTVPLHRHDDCEQVMAIVDGSVDMTIEGKRTTLVRRRRRGGQPRPRPRAVLGRRA